MPSSIISSAEFHLVVFILTWNHRDLNRWTDQKFESPGIDRDIERCSIRNTIFEMLVRDLRRLRSQGQICGSVSSRVTRVLWTDYIGIISVTLSLRLDMMLATIRVSDLVRSFSKESNTTYNLKVHMAPSPGNSHVHIILDHLNPWPFEFLKCSIDGWRSVALVRFEIPVWRPILDDIALTVVNQSWHSRCQLC